MIGKNGLFKVYADSEIQEDGSVFFSTTKVNFGPHQTTEDVQFIDWAKVPEDWPWPYTEEDFSNGWVPWVALVAA